MEKVHIFVMFLLITFGTFFKNFFIGFEISMKFCIFDTFFDLVKKIFFGHIGTLLNFEAKCAKNGSKKRKTIFYKHVLEFSYANINGLVLNQFVKIVVP